MKIAYYLNEGRKKNLYCRISDGTERVSFSLGYTIDPSEWNSKQEEGSFDDLHHFTLSGFKRYLERRYHELKSLAVPVSNVLATLKQEAETYVDASGIEGIARKLFDEDNKDSGVPAYDQFLEAFEKHTKLAKGSYKTQSLGNKIHFYTNEDQIFELDTYAGLTARLKHLVDGRHYDEIYGETNESIWSDIYIDAGIDKHQFLPVLLGEWSRMWDEQYREIREEGSKTGHLDALKEASWRGFQVFMECYDGAGDAIKLAYDIDDMGLYPLAVITMMSIFDAPTCYDEYCEGEFYAGEGWESISSLDDEDELDLAVASESPIFFIRPADY